MKAVGTTLTADRFGNVKSAAMFDGIDDYLEQSSGVMMPQGTEDFTIALWCKPAILAGDFRILVCNQRLDQLQLGVTPRGTLHLLTGGDHSNKLESPILNWNPNDWYHVGLTRRDSYIMIFRNGEMVAEHTKNVQVIVSDSEKRLRFGSRPRNSTEFKHPWNGAIDDIRIYDIALDKNQLLELYRRELKQR